MRSAPVDGSKPARGRSVRRAIVWTTGGQTVSFATQVITQVALAHLLTPREIGVYTVALATTSLVAAIQGTGLNQFVVRASDDRGLLETAFTINAVLSVTLSISIWALGYVASMIYREASVQTVMTVLAISPILGLFQFLPASIFQRDMRFDLIALINTARVLVTAFVTIALSAWHFGPMSLGWGNVSGTAVTAALFCGIGFRHLPHRFRMREWRPVTVFGLQMIAIAGVTTLSSRIADLVLGRLLGLNALGIYSRASGINAILWDNLHSVLGRIFLSDLADRHRSGQSLRASYLKILDVLTAVLWPAFAGLAVLARPLVKAVYGPNWTAAADPLSLLALSSMVLISVSMTWEIFVVCGRTGEQAKLETQRNLIGLTAFCVGCMASITAAALARVVDAVISVGLYKRPLARMTETDLADLVPIFRRSTFLTGIAITPSLVLMGLSGFSCDVSSIKIATSVGMGVVAWLLALKLTHHFLLEELRIVTFKIKMRLAA